MLQVPSSGDYAVPLDTFTLPSGLYNPKATFTGSYSGNVASVKVSVLETTGINHVTAANGIYIFPIPANDVLTIDGANFKESINEIRTTDIAGRQVKSAHAGARKYDTNYSGDRFACGHLFPPITDKNGDIK